MASGVIYSSADNYDKDQSFPSFSKPEIVGFFNLNENREYNDDIKKLSYFRCKVGEKVHFDLNIMAEKHQNKPASSEDENLDHILTFIEKNIVVLRSDQPDQILNTDFICFRGLLRLLMCSPYETREPWLIRATKYKGTIYLCTKETEHKKHEKQKRSSRDIKFMRYGYKFEQYVFAEGLKDPDGNRPVKEAEEFCVMYSSKLNGLKMLYGAEIDGVDSKHIISNLEE